MHTQIAVSNLESSQAGRPLSHEELLNQLPPRNTIEQLLSLFFDIYSPTMPVKCMYVKILPKIENPNFL